MISPNFNLLQAKFEIKCKLKYKVTSAINVKYYLYPQKKAIVGVFFIKVSKIWLNISVKILIFMIPCHVDQNLVY